MQNKIRNRGIVKFFDAQRGFGFLTRQDGVDVFVHHTGIVSDDDYRSLPDGVDVVFDIADGPRGPKAVNVEILPWVEVSQLVNGLK